MPDVDIFIPNFFQMLVGFSITTSRFNGFQLKKVRFKALEKLLFFDMSHEIS
jgi:hypothetical protein